MRCNYRLQFKPVARLFNDGKHGSFDGHDNIRLSIHVRGHVWNQIELDINFSLFGYSRCLCRIAIYIQNTRLWWIFRTLTVATDSRNQRVSVCSERRRPVPPYTRHTVPMDDDTDLKYTTKQRILTH